MDMDDIPFLWSRNNVMDKLYQGQIYPDFS
jgi:hypothetical protein